MRTMPLRFGSVTLFTAAVAVVLSLLTPLHVLAKQRAVRPRPIGHYRVGGQGVYAIFERRGFPVQFSTNQVAYAFFDFDSGLGSTVAAEVDRQLTAMTSLGINTVTLEFRASDDVNDPSFPTCKVNADIGFRWPNPGATELSNLGPLLDMVKAHGMRVFLRLTNGHMEQPFTTSKGWLGPILAVAGHHPAVTLILFEGSPSTVDTNGDGTQDACFIPAEPPLWEGTTATAAQYVKSAIAYALSLGIPPRKVSAEAVVGNYIFDVRSPAGPSATDHHLWPTVEVLKDIFDDLGIPNEQRTYAISFYEHRKCAGFPAFITPHCVDEDPHSWGDETLRNIFDIIGRGNGARVVAPEMGVIRPVSPEWRSEWALESLGTLFEKWGVECGSYWIWVHYLSQEDNDPAIEDAVKRRGLDFHYNAIARELIDLGGFHLNAIPNSSFESGGTSPSDWTITGEGSGARYDLRTEPGEAMTLLRGTYALRLTTGAAAQSAIEAVSAAIPVSQNVVYTTTVNLRFAWSGSAPGPPMTRPQAYITIRFYDASGVPAGESVFRYFEEDKTNGFATFPVQYRTPAATASVRIAIGAARNGLQSPIVLDVDNVR